MEKGWSQAKWEGGPGNLTGAPHLAREEGRDRTPRRRERRPE